MEVYLNVIETGDGTYGVEAASQRYLVKALNISPNRKPRLLLLVFLIRVVSAPEILRVTSFAGNQKSFI